MAHETGNEQVEAALVDEAHDRLDDMARDEMGLDRRRPRSPALLPLR